jgi:hypothetical protein
MEPEMDRKEAQAALDEMNAAERKLATDGPDYPLWRHAAFGAVMAVMVLGQGFALPWSVVMLVLAMAGGAALVTDDRRRYGVFVNGYRRGRTLPLTLLLLVMMLGAMAGEIYARTNGLSLVTKLGIAGIAFSIATAMSVWWTRIYQRELLGGAA